jgi:hypothetical protein
VDICHFFKNILRSGSGVWSAATATEEGILFITLKFITFYQGSLGTKEGINTYF